MTNNRSSRIILLVSVLALTVTEHCMATEVYWTDYSNGAIRRALRDGSATETVVTGLSTPTGIAIDVANGKMYWTDTGYDRIQRANVDGSEFEDLVYDAGLIHPGGIALDVNAERMYWVDTGAGKIQRANFDGTSMEDLVVDAGEGLSSIAIDVAAGKIYWTASGKIRRASLDGSAVEDFLTFTTEDHPWSLELDVTDSRVYWSDQGTHRIRRVYLDGSGTEDLVTGVHSLSNIALDPVEGKIYWTIGGEKISRANLNGTHIEDILYTTTPYGIAVVPEPFTLSLLVLGGVVLIYRKRK